LDDGETFAATVKMSGSTAAAKAPVFKTQLELIESFGRLSQMLGFPRSTGQIYGLLQSSARPLCLDEIAETLGLSKGSCSTGTRELCSLKAIRQVWVHGDRKDHFEVESDVRSVLEAAYRNLVIPMVAGSQRRTDKFESSLREDLRAGAITKSEHALIADRVKTFCRLQQKIHELMQIAERLF